MSKYHISENGTVGVCQASERPCPIGGAHADFDNLAEARVWAEGELAREYGGSNFGDATAAAEREDAIGDIWNALQDFADDLEGSVNPHEIYEIRGTAEYLADTLNDEGFREAYGLAQALAKSSDFSDVMVGQEFLQRVKASKYLP